jgi:hypothetical protein
MTRLRLFRAGRAAATLLLLAACARAGAPPSATATDAARVRAEARGAAPRPATRAERSRYLETSRHADVVAFLDTLARLDGRLYVTSLGRTTEGRDIPLVVASRPRVATPAEARALGRPVVWVQGNIHAGEVEGKEALQMLLRDLALDPRPNVLDSLVLLAVPIYNADGNEGVGPQARQRSEQNGPELVGQRPNAQGLDLNRDYMKAEAPETRASLAAFAAWDPDAFVDLHTTNGSYHGYALTWSPSLHPAAPLRAFNQDTLLPALQRRVRERHDVATFPYGNFALEYGADVNADTTKQGWFTYDHRPRFGTNYYGLRGRLSVLSEAYSHDPFETRVRATYAFVGELLSELAALGADASSRHARFRGASTEGALRAQLTERPVVTDVVAEDLVRTGDSTRTQAGVPPGLRRTGRYRTVRIPVHDRFVATRTARVPAGGWLLDAAAPGADSAVALLRRHGVEVRHAPGDVPLDVEAFRVDSVVRAARPFQGHREVRLEGTWRRERRTPADGTWLIRAGQRHALLALHLLEPESDDGLAAWNYLDAALAVGRDYPVVRVHGTAR